MSDTITAPTEATNRRHGRNRQLVLEALGQGQRPMSAYELLELLREDGLRSPLQVYRALEQLIEDGTAHKIESLSAFALCTRAECGTDGHAIFAICKKCGRAEEFHDHALERVLRRLATREGFRTKATTVELSGLCETCAHG
ncbi:transcriptional repressor [Mesorhizobium sp. M1A.T.Ca.IN.004.03.1.1]|uniref:Fur family transcriptional regulator n=1 Tax=Mesorhizobium sp. M1A.T.Ca.IN.004.03.1.1 TaxID=2496795 RepID=UPI000FCB5592|nr:Fur family transcriptional regulator [Mesorhizobium sp. M1A.T.Ca.IN.004.03.1.1]RUV40244.1 transcriptional repressor [Mesorhizobium sp. M1A.T.Ca.IN.004.03.1.1]